VKVGVLAVEEVGVGAPDLGEELPVHGQLLHVRSVVLQPAVNPVLPAYRAQKGVTTLAGTRGQASTVHSINTAVQARGGH